MLIFDVILEDFYLRGYVFLFLDNKMRVKLYSTMCSAFGFPGGSDGKEFICNEGDMGLNPGPGRSPGEGIGYPLQYSCLENSMDRGAWGATVHEVVKTEQLTFILLWGSFSGFSEAYRKRNYSLLYSQHLYSCLQPALLALAKLISIARWINSLGPVCAPC